MTTAAPGVSTTAGGGTASTAASTTAAAATSTTIGKPVAVRMVTSAAAPANAMQYAAEAYDEFAKHGVDLQHMPETSNSALNVQTLLAGDADLAIIGTSGMLGALKEGQDIVALTDYIHTPPIVFQMTKETESSLTAKGVTASSPIAARVQALKGLTIGTLPVGSTTEVIVRGTLADYGVNPDSDVTIRAFPDAVSVAAAVRAGQVDAFLGNNADPAYPILIDYSVGDVPAYKEMSFATLITTRKYLESNPDQVRGYLAAWWAGYQRLQTSRVETLRAVKDKVFPNMDQAAFDLSMSKTISAYGPGLYSSAKSFETLLKVYNSPLLADKQITLKYEDVYDTTLAEEAKPKP